MAAPQASWASYIHPALATFALVLAWLTLRRGLVIRDARVRRSATLPQGAVQRHVGLAKPVVIALVASSVIGLASAVFVRGFKPMATAHGWFALVATLGFAGTGLIGTGLTRARDQRRGLHVALSLVGLMMGLVAALTGIELLP